MEVKLEDLDLINIYRKMWEVIGDQEQSINYFYLKMLDAVGEGKTLAPGAADQAFQAFEELGLLTKRNISMLVGMDEIRYKMKELPEDKAKKFKMLGGALCRDL